MATETVETVWSSRALVYDLQTAVEPQVSPDGDLVAYGLSRCWEPGQTAFVQLRVCRIDGTDDLALTDPGHRDTQPRWAPDGERLAFTSNRVAGHGLFVFGKTGGEPEEVTRHAGPIEWPVWSPDGRWIAYTTPIDPGLAEGQVPDAAGRVRVTRRLDYKEDVRGYLGDRRSQLFVVDVATGQRRQLTGRPLDHRFPAWSTDGRRIAVQVAEKVGIRSHLELVEVLDGSSRPVHIDESGIVGLHAWSPGGDRILITGEPVRTGQPDLFLYDVASGELLRLTSDLQVMPDAGYPSSAPPSQPVWLDESTVLLHAYQAGASGLYRLDTVSGELEALTDWKAHNTSMSASRDGRRVAQSHSSLESAGEISLFDRATGSTTLITHHNREVLSQRPAVGWERFTVRRGDLDVEAWLLFPPDFHPGDRYPVVLDIHGGPQSHHGHIFNAHQQCLAGHGFLVVFANPRGSTSYGRDFASRVLRDWGGEDYLDLMAVVDAVLERPYADAGRLGVYGYSYGGYMTSWILGHTDRFQAAVCGAPCFNLTSMYGTSDIAPFWGPLQWGAPPHEDPDWYREHSPSTFAHRARTPTLIVHGEADDRCPIGQGEEMFTALSQAGCEVEMVRYPGASHLFQRLGPAGQREDFLSRVLNWFESHL